MLFSEKNKSKEANKLMKSGRDAIKKENSTDESSGDERKEWKEKLNGIVSL